MKENNIKNKVKAIITITIAVLLLWFLVIAPFISFKNNENTMLNAAKRYFEINSTLLPTGTSRIATVSLQQLAYQKYLTTDLRAPYSNKECSVTSSWVKVKQTSAGAYKYYVYLKCGVFSSNVDHQGPTIIINGAKEITIDKGTTYKDAGIKSVSDNTDGVMKNSSVDSTSTVNTKKVGTYKIVYSATDTFGNTTNVTRKVTVIEKISNTVKNNTDSSHIYKGTNIKSNYLQFSNMLFQIVGLDSNNNVKIVSTRGISAVNYDSIDDWLDNYYLDHLNAKSKEYLVKAKYCNDKVSDMNVTKCSSSTAERYAYVLSLEDYNNALVNGASYLQSMDIRWTANSKSDKESYATRAIFIGTSDVYMTFNSKYNFDIAPVLTIKGDTLVTSGDGTKDNPYLINDTTTGKAGDLVNTRNSGEYLSYSGYLWQIIDSSTDGTTKIIMNGVLKEKSTTIKTGYKDLKDGVIYNPKEVGNVGYFVSNNATEYLNTKYLVSKNIKVPIYNDIATYNGENSTKQYLTKIAIPNMYEMFSINSSQSDMNTYWLINSSKKQKYVVSNSGVVYYDASDVGYSYQAAIKAVAYLNKNCSIVTGQGTANDPYIISK